MSWQPAASIANLRLRARVLDLVRGFFADRGVLEVETPVLGAAAVTDPHLHSLTTAFVGPGAPEGLRLYLQTSPEFAMKRLLAAGSGPIFQVARAFRDGEAGRHHNPEFSLLEWYRPGFDHHALMDEVDALLQRILGTAPAERATYGEVFARYCGLDPFTAPLPALRDAAGPAGAGSGLDADDRDGWLGLLLSHRIQPGLGHGYPVFVYDFPASQAALARVEPGPPPVAERFEVFVRGIELANGYHELTDAAEQAQRFRADLADRRRRGLPEPNLDQHLLEALEAGLPACAGVAVGIDRLVMLAAGADSVAAVMAFPVDRA